MEDILDSVRRIVERWVNTASPLIVNATPGDKVIIVESTKRFSVGDEVTLKNPTEYEADLFVDEIIDDTHIRLATGVQYLHTIDKNSVLQKTINGMIIEAVYLGDPETIPMYPAITVSGTNQTSEWLTLDSTEETFNIEIGIFVLDSTDEGGRRFVYKLAKVIKNGLKKNIFPLVNDYNTTSLLATAEIGDTFIKVADSSIFSPEIGGNGSRILIEDSQNIQESWVHEVLDAETIRVEPAMCFKFSANSNTIVIQPRRFIFNSWPASIEYGKIHKGDLLFGAVISWFAKEAEDQFLRKTDTHLT